MSSRDAQGSGPSRNAQGSGPSRDAQGFGPGTVWHPSAGQLTAYAAAADGLGPQTLRAVDSHLPHCAGCRAVLARTGAVPAPLLATVLDRIDEALDEPRRGLLERGLLRLRVPEHDARVVAATPALRRGWAAGALLVLLAAVLATRLLLPEAAPITLLALAPVLPAWGIALSWGSRFDPAHEMVLTTPAGGFRIAMVRTVAVLASSTLLGALAALALPGLGLPALGWLLPSLALTLVTLLLACRFAPVYAASSAGGGWLLALGFTSDPRTGSAWLLSAPGQSVVLLSLLGLVAVLVARRPAFETMPLRPPAALP